MPYTANKKIAGLDPATTPLAAANEVPLSQAGTTVRASLSSIEAKVFDAKTALTPVSGETAVVIARQTDGTLRQVAINDIVPPLNIDNSKVSASAAIVDTKLATIATAGKVSNSATTATSANTANAIVARDASNNFSAGTITATLSGSVVGNVTGNVSGSSGSCTGNSATATTLQTARTIAISGDVTGTATSFNGSANITIPATITADSIVNADVNSAAAIAGTKIAPAFGSQNISTTGTLAAGTTTITGTCTATAFSGPLTGNVTGNASTATILDTARNLSLTGDVTATLSSFDGSANVSAAATLANSGVVAGTYNNNAAEVRPFTVDAKGRVTGVGTAVPIALDYAVISGTPYKNNVRLATTANLTATYSNGTAGVGATLTNSGTLGALSIDGTAAVLNDRVLVKDQTTSAQNGIYTVTNIGSGVAAWVLTRATDADQNSDLGGAVVTVDLGTANGGKFFTTIFKSNNTVGTTAMPWYQIVTTGDSQTISTTMLDDSSVTTTKIADSNVTTAKIADSNVTTAKIADSNVTTAKIADSNVTTAKLASTTQQSLVPAGAVMAFAMNSAPSGWLAANGTAVSRTTYAALFTAIGTTHGSGDGSTTFNLPDLRGIFVRGSGSQSISGTTYSGTFAAKQQDAFKAHTHGIANGDQNTGAITASGPINLAGVVGQDYNKGTGVGSYLTQSQSVGGTETQPANIALLYCIKF